MNYKTVVMSALLALMSLPWVSVAQVNVDLPSGRAQFSLPLCQVGEKGVNIPVALYYYGGGGVPVQQEAGHTGLGWGLSAGGSVSRLVRGLPDDFQGTNGDNRQGWLYSATGAGIESLSINYDEDGSNCAGTEQEEWNFIHGLGTTKDSEPDLFSVSGPGFGFSFVFDKDGTIRTMPYQEIKVTYTQNPDGIINAFEVTTLDGVVYKFEENESVTVEAVLPDGETAASFFQREYLYYETETSYNQAWHLSEVVSPAGGRVSLHYDGDRVVRSVNPVQVAVSQANATDHKEVTSYYRSVSAETKRLRSISGRYTKVLFRQLPFLKSGSKEKPLEAVEVYSRYFNGTTFTSTLRKSYVLGYKSIKSEGINNHRLFLTSIQERSGCTQLQPWRFSYAGVNESTNSTPLPGFTTHEADLWGFYNANKAESLVPEVFVYPDLPATERYRHYPIAGYTGTMYTIAGANRQPNALTAAYGALNKIQLPAGGYTEVHYEPNTYFDATANQTLSGGGIRVKQTITHDGQSHANDIITQYGYTDTSGVATGTLEGKPVYAFATAYYKDPDTGTVTAYSALSGNPADMWEKLTVRSAYNLSALFNGVRYGQVTVKQSGRGKTVNYYSFPVNYGDTQHQTWEATKTHFARPSATCGTLGLMGAGYYGYPFLSNANYSFASGQLDKTEAYNEAGQLVGKTENTYTPIYQTTAPVRVYGLSFELAPYGEANPAYFYGRYGLFTGFRTVMSSQQQTTYYPLTGQSMSVATNYAYGTGNHRFLVSTTTTGTDGVSYQRAFRYIQDYTLPASGGDPQTQALRSLFDTHRYAQPVETITYRIAGGQSRVTGASYTGLDMHHGYQGGLALPVTAYALELVSPVADFAPAYIDASGNFITDSRYVSTGEFSGYDEKYNLITSGDGKGNETGIHLGFDKSLPVLETTGSSAEEVAYSGFDTQTGYAFALPASPTYNTGRHTAKALVLPAGQSITATVTNKNATAFTLSAWVQAAAAGTLQFNLLDGSQVLGTATTSYQGDGQWAYQEVKLYAQASWPGTLTVAIKNTGTGSITLDDALAFPAHTAVSYYAYNEKLQRTAVTGSRGLTQTQEFDALGRLKIARDFEGNIIKRYEYHEAFEEALVLSPGFNVPAAPYDGETVNFKAWATCIDNVSYSWDFDYDANNPQFITGTSQETHVYNLPGTYQVALKASHPTLGEAVYTDEIEVLLKPLVPVLCVGGPTIIDLALAAPVGFATCDSFSGQTNASSHSPTYFEVGSIEGCDAATNDYTYEWQFRFLGSPTWEAIGIGPQISTCRREGSYEVRCLLKSVSCGREGYSETVKIEVYQSGNTVVPEYCVPE